MAVPQPVTGPDMPRALGPYSHAVRVGDLLFIAGQGGLDASGALAGDGFEAQARQAFQNLSVVLQAAGSGLQYVAKTTVYMTSAADFPKLNELFAEFFPTNPPTRAVPIVQLPRGLLISIEAIATIPG